MPDIADWLQKLGLGQYAQRFAEDDIDIDVLNELTDQDFDRLSVSLGHRRRMIRAIRELGAKPVAAVAEAEKPPPTTSEPATKENVRAAKGRGLVIAPPAADGSAWTHSFGDVSTAFASGWMLLRGTRRWRAADRGFAMSDHADWDGLIDSIRATGAERVLVTHGYTAALSRWLGENGWKAEVVRTHFEGDANEEVVPPESPQTLETAPEE